MMVASGQMRIVAIISLCGLGVALASMLAVYSYGRFAERARGAPSTSLPLSPNATPLDIGIAPLLSSHPGQSGLMLVSRNLHAFAVRAHAARSAGRSLDLQYYYWKDDLTGGLLGREVIAAADRGVRVRMLLDDISTRGDDANYLALNRHPNIEVRLFNPSRNRAGALRRGLELLLRAFSATRRMHNKAWIADGRMAVVGGRNVGDAYFDASEISNFRDMDVLLLGPLVRQAETVFDSYWNSIAALPITSLASSREGDLPKLKVKLEALAANELAEPFLRRVADEGNAQAMLSGAQSLHWTTKAAIVSDPPEKASGAGETNWLTKTIFPMVRSAKSDLEIISPYFIPGDEGTRTLRDLAGGGVAVSVLTNSLAATDVAAVHGAYAHYREPLLAGGVRLFELRPEITKQDISLFGSSGASLHTKAFMVDRKSGFIGSFNFDPRSISLNTEMGVVFEHAELTEEVRAVFSEEISPQSSYRVFLEEGDLAWQDDSGAEVQTLYQEPRASIWRRMAATIVGFLPIESQL
jgi:putative cardiolipin synthase